MIKRNFRKLLEKQGSGNKFVCIGLDSELEKIPATIKGTVAGRIISFNQAIVDATKDIVCAYKPQVAFYEAQGDEGWRALRETIFYIHKTAPDVPVILDAKCNDIGNTSEQYAHAVFEWLETDAVTVNPYLGGEALQPFLNYADKGIIILCRTSNPGAGEFQDLLVSIEREEHEFLRKIGLLVFQRTCLYNHVAYQVSHSWNKNGNCALVVGATSRSNELRGIRKIIGDMPILIPGIGAQGGDVEETVSAGKDSRGQGIIVNSSRGIIFASKGEDFAEAARRKTIELHNLINLYR